MKKKMKRQINCKKKKFFSLNKLTFENTGSTIGLDFFFESVLPIECKFCLKCIKKEKKKNLAKHKHSVRYK